jgi:hypothetical protein
MTSPSWTSPPTTSFATPKPDVPGAEMESMLSSLSSSLCDALSKASSSLDVIQSSMIGIPGYSPALETTHSGPAYKLTTPAPTLSSLTPTGPDKPGVHYNATATGGTAGTAGTWAIGWSQSTTASQAVMTMTVTNINYVTITKTLEGCSGTTAHHTPTTAKIMPDTPYTRNSTSTSYTSRIISSTSHYSIIRTTAPPGNATATRKPTGYYSNKGTGYSTTVASTGGMYPLKSNSSSNANVTWSSSMTSTSSTVSPRATTLPNYGTPSASSSTSSSSSSSSSTSFTEKLSTSTLPIATSSSSTAAGYAPNPPHTEPTLTSTAKITIGGK